MNFLVGVNGPWLRGVYRLAAFTLVFMATANAFALPYELSYGGRLTESSGKPVAGPVDLRVTFFRSVSGNDQVAVSLADFMGVTLQDGIFQIPINLPAADFHTLFNGVDAAFIQVEDLTHSVTYPRQRFSAVPYALKVPVDGESITYNANGRLSLGNGSNTLKLPSAAGALNKVLKSDGAGALIWADDLSGGGAGSITTTEIQDGTLTNVDISATAAIAVSKISGLGDAATKNVGTGATNVAAGDHGHSAATTGAPGFMSSADKTKLDGIASGAGVDTNAKTLCADGEYLRGEDTTTCKTSAQIVSDGGAVKTSDTGTVSGTMIANGAIDLNKLSATICGANQVLKMNSGGTALTCGADATASSSYAAKSADYTVTISDNNKLLDVTNQTTISLFAAATAGSGFTVTIKNSGSALVRIMPNGAEIIEGQNIGMMLMPNYGSVTMISSGSDWRVASVGYNTIYFRASSFSNATCGGAGDYCYDSTNAKALGFAVTPTGKALQYSLTKDGFYVWKEVGGHRILRSDGSDNWQMMLNIDGKGHSATAFTYWQDLVGRTCPTNVYIDDSNKFTIGNCLYYNSEIADTNLSAAGTSQTVAGSIGLAPWNNYNGGSAKWYVGNIEVCSKKGMRLPTLYETTNSDLTTSNRPLSDGTPSYAGATGVPVFSTAIITASSYTGGLSLYWILTTSIVSNTNSTTALPVRCVLP